jgi:DNA polymerase III epsilon subunit-like protein
MEIVIFDTETTGLLLPDNAPLADQPKIIEFYGCRINEEFEILSEVETFLNPGEPLTKEITRITGIKDSDVISAPTFKDKADEINALFEGADLTIAHNVAFDNGMLSNEFDRIDSLMEKAKHDLCTVDHLIPVYGRRISLSALYKKLYGKYFVAHRAKNDVFALVSVVHKLVEEGVINFEEYQ